MEKKELTLMQVLDMMRYYNSHGFECHFEGQGDGSVKIIAQDSVIYIR
jgi:hypothetical protein